MLAFLAALIPIAGSLLAGGSFLAEQGKLAHESRVRYRVNKRVESIASPAERERVRELLLDANGVPPAGMTWDDLDVHFAMSGTLPPRTERQRQWVLLMSAVAGLILLCVDSASV